MKRTYRLPILFAVVGALFSGAVLAVADDAMNGFDDDGSQGPDVPSQKQYDKRLPPVLPGEEIVTESGQRMRVWSSAGPVPINQPTAVAYPNGGYYGGFPPVIINDPGFRGGPGAGAPGAGLAPGGGAGGVAPLGRGGR